MGSKTQLDTFIMMGSPLDVWPIESNDDLDKLKPQIRGKTFNYWSTGDEWAYRKGGIGCYGGDLAKNAKYTWITNREFAPGRVIHGYALPSRASKFHEFDHSDYMERTEFFAWIHGVDIQSKAPYDLLLSSIPEIPTMQMNATGGW